MVTNGIFSKVFVDIRSQLTDEERERMAKLSSQSVAYLEECRDLIITSLDDEIDNMRADHSFWSVDFEDERRPTDMSSGEDGPDLEKDADSDTVHSALGEQYTMESKVRCGDATVEDIKPCKDQRHAVRVIGEINTNGFAVSQAAALIHSAGLSKGTVESVASNIHGYMSRQPEWEKIGPSRFRLLPTSP